VKRRGGLLLLVCVLLAACANQAGGQPAKASSTIAVGGRPGVVALGEGAAWVPNTADGTLTKIDPRTNRVVATWRIGSPAALRSQGCTCYSVHQCPNGTFRVRKCDVPSAVAAGGGSVWVPRNDHKSLLRLDPRTGRLQAEIWVGINVWDLAVAPSGVWLTDYFGSKLVHVDPANNWVVNEIDSFPVGAGSLLAVGGSIWVSAVNADELIEVDAHDHSILARVPVLPPGAITYVGFQPLSLVYAHGAIWTRDVKAAKLTRIDPVTATVTGVYPVDAFFGRDGVDSMAVAGDKLYLGGVRLQCFDLNSGAVTRGPQIAAAVSGGADGTIWVTDLANRVQHLPAPSC
jgi:streptogramin lyase